MFNLEAVAQKVWINLIKLMIPLLNHHSIKATLNLQHCLYLIMNQDDYRKANNAEQQIKQMMRKCSSEDIAARGGDDSTLH